MTDINGAILNGIDVLKLTKQEGDRSPILLFLTDGHASSGVQNRDEILKNIEKTNEGNILII